MNLWRYIARVFWAIGDAFISLGDRAYDRVLDRDKPLDFDQAVTATLRMQKEIAANVARNNAVFDDLQKGPKA
jgi:hypothetical protein